MERVSSLWIALKKAMDCKTKASEAHNPESIGNLGTTGTETEKPDKLSNSTSKHGSKKVKKLDVVEAHNLPNHAVTELREEDSTRKIVEIICQTSWLKSDQSDCVPIERVLKVNNMQNTLTWFEEHRELVKAEACKLPKKDAYARCLADGNELLGFYGTTFACSLGMDGSTSLCNLDNCGICLILRNGFSTNKEFNGGVGVLTTSTSARAFEAIELHEEDKSLRKALIVCRVLAGRINKPTEKSQEMDGSAGFDSLAGKMSSHSDIDELYVLNPRAVLPCFVVVYHES